MAKPSVSPRSLQTRISHILKHWPTDAVRPANVSVQNYLQSRIGHKTPNASPDAQSTPVSKPGGELSEASVNALTSLLNDRFARRYPLSSKIRHPASDPDYYDNLIREFEEAPSRDWFGRLKKRLGGILRFS
ncbi:hypothetical protein N7532_011880 [Penicillium argentinense]|uniref:Uncharacterized protein n=1 Tax=Penicillium argentinense TaxID=1131581 RepID=A0A9W9EJA6_9EURO|nr:uncharacterized protein N7532_011880 [Penicillium argentinense]KAJ5082837.1 hypothetical protein N7532_011880 [Penicillium argentinense]